MANVREDEARHVAQALIERYVADRVRRDRCLVELATAEPAAIRNGWRFVVPSYYTFDDDGTSVTIVDRGFCRVAVSSTPDPFDTL